MFTKSSRATLDASDLGPARRALVGVLALAIVAFGTVGWAHTDRATQYASAAASHHAERA